MKLVDRILRRLKQKSDIVFVIPFTSTPSSTPSSTSSLTTSTVPVELPTTLTNDGFVFDNEGFPTNIDNNAHYITKRQFTPSVPYVEPPFSPWLEQQRIRQSQLPQQTDIKIEGSIHVYNGYPIEFVTENGNKIAINNRGDFNFNFAEQYSLQTENNRVVYKGTVKQVLNCDIVTRDYILQHQGEMLIV